MARPGMGEEDRRTRTASVRVTEAEVEPRELNRIGVNLNHMARSINSGAVSSPAANAQKNARRRRIPDITVGLLHVSSGRMSYPLGRSIIAQWYVQGQE